MPGTVTPSPHPDPSLTLTLTLTLARALTPTPTLAPTPEQVIRTGQIKMLQSRREYRCAKCEHRFTLLAMATPIL